MSRDKAAIAAVDGTRNGTESPLLFVDEVAKRLNLTKHTVTQMCRDERIRSERIGNRYRIPAAAVDEFLDSIGRAS